MSLPSPSEIFVRAYTEKPGETPLGAKPIGNREDRVPTLVLRSHWSLGGYTGAGGSRSWQARKTKKGPQAEAGFAIRHGSPGSGGASVLPGDRHTRIGSRSEDIYRSSGAVSLEHGGQVRERELRRHWLDATAAHTRRVGRDDREGDQQGW